MKLKQFCALIFAFSFLVFGGCATIKSTEIKNHEGTLEKTPKIARNLDYGERRIDANISSAIKRKFAIDQLISESSIRIDTNHCNVTLKGNVGTQAEVDRAMRLGRSVYGVRSVHSDIIVKSVKAS